jgi:hypothetical protein
MEIPFIGFSRKEIQSKDFNKADHENSVRGKIGALVDILTVVTRYFQVPYCQQEWY